jgi:hypothetical protein
VLYAPVWPVSSIGTENWNKLVIRRDCRAGLATLYAELLRNWTYKQPSTPCAGYRPIASIFDRIEVHVSGLFR